MCEGILGDIVKEEVEKNVKMKECSEEEKLNFAIVVKVRHTKLNDNNG